MNFIAMDFETANAKPYSACSLALVMVRDSLIVGEYYTSVSYTHLTLPTTSRV